VFDDFRFEFKAGVITTNVNLHIGSLAHK
jgi:hypothetical protein